MTRADSEAGNSASKPDGRMRELEKAIKPKAIPEKMATVCKHPRVRIVSRLDDAEFVECLECGEVFDSEEFHDMEIEEAVEPEEAETE